MSPPLRAALTTISATMLAMLAGKPAAPKPAATALPIPAVATVVTAILMAAFK
jgi:hypothetical protein